MGYDHPYAAFEAAFAKGMRAEYELVQAKEHDLISHDGTRAIELKLSMQGVRDLLAPIVRLAMLLTNNPKIRRATLVAANVGMGTARIYEEWSQVGHVLNPELRDRLALVVRTIEGWVVLPEKDDELSRIAEVAQRAFPVREDGARPVSGPPAWTPSRQEVWKVLLDAWLGCERPLQVQDIANRAGCSLPTVYDTLHLLQDFSEVFRGTRRSVSFRAFPRQSTREMLSVARLTRDIGRYADTSGRRIDVNQLLTRLEKLAPKNVALGGVIGARRYVDNFDLNGLPRIDVSVLRNDPLDWLRKLDPALKRQEPGHDVALPSILVVHAVARSKFADSDRSHGPLPIADRAETLLDLYDLGLHDQAEAFVQTLRAKGPKSADVYRVIRSGDRAIGVGMAKGLDGRSRNQDGTIRRKRGDTLVETIRKDTPRFAPGYRKDTHLDTVRKNDGVDSLDGVLRKEKGK